MLHALIPKITNIFIIPPAGPNPPPAGGYNFWNNPIEVKTAEVVADKGIVGDRFFDVDKFKLPDGTLRFFSKSRNVSFMSLESIKILNNKFGITAKDLRRNFITVGIKLEDLIGKKFQIADSIFLAVETCKGCRHIETVNNIDGLSRELHDKGGIRAKVLRSGIIKQYDYFHIL